MELKNKIPAIKESIEDHKENLKANKVIFDILEGNLQKYLVKALEAQIGPKCSN